MINFTNNQEIQGDFETYSRIQSEELNKVFLKSASELLSKRIDRNLKNSDFGYTSIPDPVSDENTYVHSLRMALFTLALFLYNNRDFIQRNTELAVMKQVTLLASPHLKLGRFLESE